MMSSLVSTTTEKGCNVEHFVKVDAVSEGASPSQVSEGGSPPQVSEGGLSTSSYPSWFQRELCLSIVRGNNLQAPIIPIQKNLQPHPLTLPPPTQLNHHRQSIFMISMHHPQAVNHLLHFAVQLVPRTSLSRKVLSTDSFLWLPIMLEHTVFLPSMLSTSIFLRPIMEMPKSPQTHLTRRRFSVPLGPQFNQPSLLAL